MGVDFSCKVCGPLWCNNRKLIPRGNLFVGSHSFPDFVAVHKPLSWQALWPQVNGLSFLSLYNLPHWVFMKIKWDPRQVFTAAPGAQQDLNQAPSPLSIYTVRSPGPPPYRTPCVLLHRAGDTAVLRTRGLGCIQTGFIGSWYSLSICFGKCMY